MRIELDFCIEPEEYKNFEDLVKFVKNWERSAAKNRRFKGVKIVKIDEENFDNGYPSVTFEGEEHDLKKLFLYYCGLSKKNAKDAEGDFEAHVVSECGDPEKKTEEVTEVEKLNEIDYSENNARRHHFKSANKNAKYWIYASDTDLSHINYFVKINWDVKKPFLAPTTTIDGTARSDLRPFMTEDPAKIHSVALMVSKSFPKFWFNIQDEAYRETTLSRFNNTARPAGTGIVWDPKIGAWTGGIDEKLPPPKPISKKDDIFRDKEEKTQQSKYEKMDPRKLPYEQTRLEKEIARVEKTVEDIKKSGNKSGKQEQFEKQLETLKAELEEVKRLIG